MSKIVAVTVLAAVIGMAAALKCHQCTSFKHAMCNDPFTYEPNEGMNPTPKTGDFLKDCPNDGNNYTICRKIYQNVRGDERIIRSCGFEVYKKDCYKTVLEEYNTYVCQCDTDGCNGASGLATSTAAAFALALAVAVRNNMAL